MMSLKEAIEKYLDNDEYEVYGIRVDDKCYKIGEECDYSHQWYQDPEFGEDEELVYPYNEDMGLYDAGELDGTCSISIRSHRAVELASRYSGKHIYVIAGNVAEEGNDPDEIIISDAKVVAIIK